ncbi:MAG: hypothetical protein ABSF87_20360 [Xanthobacteraceae bacterium]|jgi:hypothetical protein
MDSRYSINLFCKGGEGAGIEQVLDQYLNLIIARAVFKAKIKEYLGRLIMLCDQDAKVLARSDRLETIPK